MISVIIPALNEEAHIGTCIDAIKRDGDSNEIIVADGGSSDRTAGIAEGYQGIKVVHTARGRGLQMNAGALHARGEILLFLHADTILEEGWSRTVESALHNVSAAGGAFTFAIDNPERKYRAVEQWVRLRCSLFMLPYGDQGIFVKGDVFKRLKGYKDIPLMEDVDLVERMKSLGKIVIVDKKAFTSERRWLKRGLVRTAALNQLIMLLYRMGMSPHKLAKIYYR
ncbi:MAG: TIGR04283 family arsenosugar biosynthesis glycosyltransferase [Nitrospirota bacterium]|nr:TIGR04283 family arsenosugar biosynthesis glycosyltransferase [Nitrospirota bacterium]